MNHKIFKYLIEGTTQITLPVGSIVLSAKNQYERVVLYVSVPDQGNQLILEEKRTFKALSTGIAYDKSYAFIDTIIFEEGDYVLHVFEDVNSIESV